MHWVIQSNLYNEDAFAALLEQLDRQEVSYEVVKVIPFIAELEPDINPVGPVFVVGATSMSKVSKRKGWTPGYIDANLEYDNLLMNYGQHMLNAGAVVARMRDLQKVWDEFHLRPVADSKSFSGMVTSWSALETWREQLAELDGDQNSLTTLTLDDLVVMSPLKDIWAEYRFHVIKGKVISGSLYKQGKRVYHSSSVDQSVTDFAQEMADLWSPNEAYALDIADTPDGYKVIEINSINSAGLYALNMGKFIAAINEL